MTDTTVVTSTAGAPVSDPVWWHRVLADMFQPRVLLAGAVLLLIGLAMWWDDGKRQPSAVMTQIVQGLLMAISTMAGWAWGKSANEAMKDKTIQDLVAKAPPTETTITTTTSAKPADPAASGAAP